MAANPVAAAAAAAPVRAAAFPFPPEQVLASQQLPQQAFQASAEWVLHALPLEQLPPVPSLPWTGSGQGAQYVGAAGAVQVIEASEGDSASLCRARGQDS